MARQVADLVEQGDLDAAPELIEDANELAPDARYTFMRASLEEQLDRCDAAVALYREFLRAPDIGEADRSEAEAGLVRCGAEPPKPPPPRIIVKPAPPPAPIEPATATAAPPPRVDGWGIGLTTAGVVVGAVGAGLWGQALLDTRSARQADDRSRFLELSQRASRLEQAGISLVSVGAAVAFAGIVRLAVWGVRRGRPRNRSRAMVSRPTKKY